MQTLNTCSTAAHKRPALAAVTLLSSLGLWMATTLPAHALPSFARQTGEECASCHVGAFGPQLTPHGMKFKLEGYTESNTTSPLLPLSGMVVGSYAHLKNDLPDGTNNQKAIQEASVFLAGKITDHLGSFIQATTASGAHGRIEMDNLDLRYARPRQIGDGETLLGVSVNNNPTVQDPLNTVPAWRFPYMASEMVGPMASPLLDGGLSGQVLGASAYALWNDSVYAELGGYKSLSLKFQDNFANLNDRNDPEGGKIDGLAPYWRLAYIKDNHKDAWSVGLVGMSADLQPGYVSGPSDKYRDIGIDASYQFLGNRKNILALNTSYIHEKQTLDASDPGNKVNLNRFDMAGSWHYDQTYGLSLGLFNVNGSANATLYADSADGFGSASNKPDSRGYTLQADWTPFGKEGSWGAPWANMRLGLQYTAYTKFNGASHAYDGSGRDASDNNTLYAFLWTAF